MQRAVITLTWLATLLASPITLQAARQPDVGTWVDKHLATFVTEQLTTHPRFKGELVKFVVFEDGNPAPRSNALAVALKNRLLDAVIDAPGVRVGWPAGHQPGHQNGTAIDCSRDNVHYFIGLEISESKNGQYKVDLRALDLEDRSWVAGFARTWKGTLSRSERRDHRKAVSDIAFRGQRSVPFTDNQPDLLAAHLAHDLGCSLLRQVSGEYHVTLESGDKQSGPVDNMVELVSNNLSAYNALQVTRNAESANAVLKGKAHPVDDDLYQYWIVVAPIDAGSDLPALSASAYIHLPDSHTGNSSRLARRQMADTLPPVIVSQSDANVLSSMRIVELRRNRVCESGSVSSEYQFDSGTGLRYWDDDCFALQVKTTEDAIVFFLNHQLNHGLVRLSNRDCNKSTEARIARANEALDYALPLISLTRDASSPATAWQIRPGADTYYAIAVSDTKAARALSRHLAQLPRRCTMSVRPGLEGVQLKNWLADFSAVVDQWQPHIDWQAIHVRNVF